MNQNLDELQGDLELEGLDDELWNAWEAPVSDFTPPPKGLYTATILEKRSATVRDEKYLDFECDYMLHREPDGRNNEYDGRKIAFMRFSSQVRDRFDGVRTSSLLDVCKALGSQPPKGAKAVGAFIDAHILKQTKFQFTWDWQGYCAACYEVKLKELTKAPSLDLAKVAATAAQVAAARKFATKAKTMGQFPLVAGKNGDKPTRAGEMECPACKGPIKARGQVKNYLVPVVAETQAKPVMEAYN